MTLRLGVVGAGANTRARHLPGFQAIPGVEVVAVCNRTRESGERVAAEFNIPRVFDNWLDLVNDAQVDAVCVGTWPYLHGPVTLASLAAGKHVLTEARLAMDYREAQAMAAAAAATDRVAMVVPAPFYLESEPVVLPMVADGFFGDWLEIHVRAMGGVFDPLAPLHWRQRRDLSGQNTMALGIVNETVRRYAGDETSVSALARIFTPTRLDAENGQSRPVDVPESLGVLAEMACGATAVYHLSSVTPHGRNGVFEFHGTRAALRLADGSAWVATGVGGVFSPVEVSPQQRGGWRVELDFVDAIRQGRPVTRTSFADGVKYMAFTEAVHRSLRAGARVALPLRD